MFSLRVWFGGVWRAVCAPVTLLALYALTLVVAAPLGAWLQRSLPNLDVAHVAEANDPPAPDIDWLDEVSVRATGPARLLTPAVFGVAAPIGNLDAVLDGRRPPLPLVAPIAVFFVCWTAAWGGVIARLANGSRIGARAALGASRRSVVPLLVLGIAGGLAYLVLYLTIHAALFGPLYDWLIAGALERTAFCWRLALAAVFGGLLLAVGQVLDFAKLALVLGGATVQQAVRDGAALARQRWFTVAVLLLFNGVGLAVLLAGYAASEFIPGGSVPSLWRIVAGGQALILGRLFLRLLLTGAQVELYLRRRAEPAAT